MAEHDYYEAELAGGARVYDKELRDAINEYGARRRQHYDARYESSSNSWTHVVVDQWARGPLLYLEEFDGDGNTRKPTLGNGLVSAILHAGYVPWGFRPEKSRTSEGREHTGRWMWYLRPVEHVHEPEEEVYTLKYALKNNEGTYLRGDDDFLLTFDNRGDAEAVAETTGEHEVVEVAD